MGRNTAVKYPASFAIPGDQEVVNLLALARDLGINLVDTAPAYGNSESRLGALLTDRHHWVICTKAGERYEGQSSSFDFSPQGLTLSVETSLLRLRTDYLDVVLLHLPDDDSAVLASDAMASLRKMKDKGMVRAIGASTKSASAGLRALEESEVVMVAYHREDTSQQVVLDAAHNTDRGVLIKKGLASGHSRSPTENLDFLMNSTMSSVVVGTINPVHLTENVTAVNTTRENESSQQ